ncbi:MAG TPA: dihydrolipoamide acetyltransferase family protein [Bacteroidales bacterium]|nr:dihydrolipoamide acetyltransferase family protein [Bacteroidales bacterium]
MAVPVIMPRQGQSVETCIITRWIKSKGDAVKTGDILFSYETDKAAFDVEAQADGILLDTFYGEGDEVPVLTNVAVIGQTGEPVENLRPGSEIAPAVIPAATEQVRTGEKSLPDLVSVKDQPEDMRLRISPRARIMAVRMGVDPASLAGSGPNGRVIVRDIEAAVTAPAHTTGVAAEFTETKLSNIRKLIARAMYESISQSAQLTHHMSADVRKLLELRNKVKADMEKGNPLNITLNDMICFAVIRALEKFPLLNSHFLGESTRTFRKVHLGLAVDTPRGLMVPAIQNADDLSLKGLSVRLREIADQCKKGNINPELLASNAASFTVSNLGNYGVEMFTPIINLPQVAILGVNTITHRPADLGNGIFGFVPVIGLSLTYDHRAVDGGPATLFLREIKNQIENFEEKI